MAGKTGKIDLETFNELVNAIYTAAIDNALWPQFLEAFANALNSKSGLLRIADLQANNLDVNITHGLDPWFQRQYADHYIQLDQPTRLFAQLKVGSVAQTATYIPVEYRKTAYYNEYVRPQGSDHIISGMLTKKDGRIAHLSLQRTDRIGHYEPYEVDAYKLLIPHLQRAIDINRLLLQRDSHCSAANNILDRLQTAIILVDRQGKPHYINKSAEALIADDCGIALGQNGIQLNRYEDTQALQKLIYSASQARLRTGGTVVVPDPSSTQPLSILVTPINREQEIDFGIDVSPVTAALFIGSNESPTQQLPVEIIGKLYGLTYAEARLSAALANGLDINEIAAKYNVSKGTLRSQLKSCFQKTGVKRQVDLVNLILSGPAALVSRSDI